MSDHSEPLRYLELARRWDKPASRFSSDMYTLKRTPTLRLIRGWDEKDKRYFLKKLREIEGKLSAWIEMLEEEVY